MNNQKNYCKIIIAGDTTMDWNFARLKQAEKKLQFWSPENVVKTFWQRGGCALLADLIEEVCSNLRSEGVIESIIKQNSAPCRVNKVYPGDPRFHHSYVNWVYKESNSNSAWRVEDYLGLERSKKIDSYYSINKVNEDIEDPDLVVLDDAGLGFRDVPELWPVSIREPKNLKPWVLVKMAMPVAQGLLWEQLHQHFSDRLVIIMTIEDVRLTEVQISKGLSWERTAQDLYWEIIHNPSINALSHSAYTIVSFGTAGIFKISRQERSENKIKSDLFFDPEVIEGVWENKYPGGVIGKTTCLTASIAKQLILDPLSPDIDLGIQNGISAMRTLHILGYGSDSPTSENLLLQFPKISIAKAFNKNQEKFVRVRVQPPFIRTGNHRKDLIESGDINWTILKDQYKESLDIVASNIVLEGPDTAICGVPWGVFGSLITLDWREIEGFRSVGALIEEYYKSKTQTRPLSIAVFGSPGSGKSYGIIQLCKSLLPEAIKILEFNLSQFLSTENLEAAFHQVRDINLSGKIPLVIWDEFDSFFENSPLGWLKYFLAPMQDGNFLEGQISHPIGKSIFVFTGGTTLRMESFGKELDPETLKLVKVPDFISRLKGYVNILGPNPINSSKDNVNSDPYYIIRRALLLRSLFKKNMPNLFINSEGKDHLNIDSGVLRAFLKTINYKHGVRSIESIIAMSQLTGESRFERSSLPAESQLDIHVDAKGFLSLVQEIELKGEVLEQLAKATHEIFCEGLRSRGYQFGTVTSESDKTHSALIPYENLDESLKEQNRQSVKDIPNKLSKINYIMIHARTNEIKVELSKEQIEILSKFEHERWLNSKLEDGWTQGDQTDREQKKHKLMVPYKELSEEEKDKDRDLVRGIPDILYRAGYTIEKTMK
ncbi:ATPase [Candidatus Dojkabacteria bacterium]|nr:ATPase [Candidatus Dojkabacteria bacterium]